jgi:hypothetical protein
MNASTSSLFNEEPDKSLLDQLLNDAKLYTQSQDYKNLLDFTVKLRNFAPFNAMLLQIQKPGLSFAASSLDWRLRFGRYPKYGARPLLILWPFGPVALVYDVLDTEGKPLPDGVLSFYAQGDIDKGRMEYFKILTQNKNIKCKPIDQGDTNAGSVRVVKRDEKNPTQYEMYLNSNHEPAVQFSTLAHELGHIFLGHLGPDRHLKVPNRQGLKYNQREIEAESVSYIVCERNGVKSKAESYLSGYIEENSTSEDIDVYRVMRAAGQVESLLELTAKQNFK